MPPSIQTRLETLIANIEKAETAVRDGYRINRELFERESIAIARALKTAPDAKMQPLLKQAVMALERLTDSLQARVTDLKSKTKKS